MGVKDLMAWIKRVHPSAVTQLPARFESAQVKGMRVAIDGTLITNRYHFAYRRRMDQRGTHALRGWYGLITEMRHSGVQPVVLWDERGERPWKALEARRRLQSRATALARKLHEDRRAIRLARLHRELMRFGCLSAREQGAVRMWWRSRGEGEGEEGEVGSISAVQGTLSTSPPFSSRSLASPSPRPNANTDLFSPSGLLTLYIISRLSGHISRLSWLADAYDSTTFTSDNSALPTLFEAFEEEETEVWRIASGLGPDAEGEALTVSAEIWADESEEISLALEARLLALEPASSYSETKRQRALTEGEGDVWELAFGSVSLESAPEAGEAGVGACSDLALGLTAALAQLDGLRADAPAVRATYVSNLIVPLESEHAACRDLLRKMGVPVLLAPVPFEAEGVASAMALRGEVDFVGTEDSDVIVYGAPLLRNLSTASAPLVLVDSQTVRTLARWSEAAFRDFCILLGTDASPRLPGIGPAAASAYIGQHGSVEKVLSQEPFVRARLAKLYRPEVEEEEAEATEEEIDAFLATVNAARTLFDPTLVPSLSLGLSSEDEETNVRAWLAERGVLVLDMEDGEEQAEEDGEDGREGEPQMPDDDRRLDGWDEVWGDVQARPEIVDLAWDRV